MKKVQYKSFDGRVTTQIEGDTDTDIAERLCEFHNLFETNNVCGLCGNEDVFFNVREVEGNKYYEKKCADLKCGASFPLHVYKKIKGGLYSKWDDKWKKWEFKPKDVDEVENEVPAKAVKKGGK